MVKASQKSSFPMDIGNPKKMAAMLSPIGKQNTIRKQNRPLMGSEFKPPTYQKKLLKQNLNNKLYFFFRGSSFDHNESFKSINSNFFPSINPTISTPMITISTPTRTNERPSSLVDNEGKKTPSRFFKGLSCSLGPHIITMVILK